MANMHDGNINCMTKQPGKKGTKPRVNNRQRVAHQRLKYNMNAHEGLITTETGFIGLHTLVIMCN